MPAGPCSARLQSGFGQHRRSLSGAAPRLIAKNNNTNGKNNKNNNNNNRNNDTNCKNNKNNKKNKKNKKKKNNNINNTNSTNTNNKFMQEEAVTSSDWADRVRHHEVLQHQVAHAPLLDHVRVDRRLRTIMMSS